MARTRLTNELTRDAHELATALADGQGYDALDVIFGGAYPGPTEKAILLRAAAAVMEDGS